MFANVVGHEAAQRALTRALASSHLSHAYLFVGPPQVGKRTLAKGLAQALLCAAPTPACGECGPCRRVAASRHPDLVLMGSEGHRGPRADLVLGQVHELQRMLGLAAFEGRCRVAIVDGAERLTHEAANALLKTLEEPPPASYLFLLSEAEDRVLPTIISRCQRLVLGPLAKSLVEDALVERWGANRAQAALLAEHAGGRLGWAVEALQDPVLMDEVEARLSGLIRLLAEGITARLATAADLAEQAGEDPEATLGLLTAWRRWWEGVLLAKGGVLVADEGQRNLAEELSWASVLAAVRSADATRELWEHNVNPLLAFEHSRRPT